MTKSKMKCVSPSLVLVTRCCRTDLADQELREIWKEMVSEGRLLRIRVLSENHIGLEA